MTDWTVTIECAGDTDPLNEDDVDRLVDELAPYAGVITGTAEAATDIRYGATLSIRDAADIVEAVALGVQTFEKAARGAGLPELPIVRADALTWAEHDADLERPDARLLGIAEIAELLGINRQRASTLQTRAGFPAPRARLASGPVWELRDIAEFERTWTRKPGRPRKDERAEA